MSSAGYESSEHTAGERLGQTAGEDDKVLQVMTAAEQSGALTDEGQVLLWQGLTGQRGAPPDDGDRLDGVWNDLDDIVVPGTTHWQHPGHFAYFPANTSGPSVLGDLISAGLGTQGMMWSTGPACTEVATVMLDRLSDRFAPTEEEWRRAVEEEVPGGDRRYFRDRPPGEVLPWQHIVYNSHRKLELRLEAHRMRADRVSDRAS